MQPLSGGLPRLHHGQGPKPRRHPHLRALRAQRDPPRVRLGEGKSKAPHGVRPQRGGPLGLHHLHGLRGGLPGGQRADAPHPGRAPGQGPHGGRVSPGAQQRLPGHGEGGQPLGHQPGQAHGLGRGASRAQGGGKAPPRGPLLGGVRRQLRPPGPEDRPEHGPDPERRRGGLGGLGHGGEVHRGRRQAGGQRVPILPAGHGERGNPEPGGPQDHRHHLPPLLPHHRQRVQGLWREL